MDSDFFDCWFLTLGLWRNTIDPLVSPRGIAALVVILLSAPDSWWPRPGHRGTPRWKISLWPSFLTWCAFSCLYGSPYDVICMCMYNHVYIIHIYICRVYDRAESLISQFFGNSWSSWLQLDCLCDARVFRRSGPTFKPPLRKENCRKDSRCMVWL